MNDMSAQVLSTFDTLYAPTAWKKSFSGWEMNREMDTVKNYVLSRTDIKINDFQMKLGSFFKSTKDYHVSVRFLRTEQSTLPFTIRGTDKRLFLVHIDRTKLPMTAFPFNVGDEILEMGNKPILDLVEELKLQGDHNVPITDLALAQYSLTKRRSSRLQTVPKGPVEFKIMKKGATAASTIQLHWNHTDELIDNSVLERRLIPNPFKEQKYTFKDREMVADIALDFAGENNFGIGAKQSFIPSLGLKLWETDKSNSFQAREWEANRFRKNSFLRCWCTSSQAIC